METTSPEMKDEIFLHEQKGEWDESESEKSDRLLPELEKVVPARILTTEEVKDGLSFVGKIADGSGYAYLRCTVSGMELTDIKAILPFKYLQAVVLSNNSLKLAALQEITKLPHLLFLDASVNLLDSPNLYECEFLQVLIMNKNAISSVRDVYHPELSTFEATHTNISEIHFEKQMPSFKVLDLSSNYIHSLGIMDFPALDSLYLANNKITSVIGISKYKTLRIIHLRNNPLRSLTGFEERLPKLKYLNLRNCRIGTMKQIRKLRPHKYMETIILKGTPLMGGTAKEEDDRKSDIDDPETRIEVLAVLGFLKRLNKDDYTNEERYEAKTLSAQWAEEGAEESEEELGEEANPNDEEYKSPSTADL